MMINGHPPSTAKKQQIKKSYKDRMGKERETDIPSRKQLIYILKKQGN